MFEGKYTRWGIWAPGHDLAGMVSVELKERNYSKADLRVLIEELMAIRDRLVGPSFTPTFTPVGEKQ